MPMMLGPVRMIGMEKNHPKNAVSNKVEAASSSVHTGDHLDCHFQNSSLFFSDSKIVIIINQ